MKEKVSTASLLAILSGFLFYAYEYILRIIPSVMEPQFTSSMHLNASAFGAISAYYYYAYTPLQLVVGIVLDKYELRKTLTIASLMCALGTFLILASSSSSIYSIGRFIQGCGSAFAWIGILKLAAVYVPKRFYGLATSMGAVFGFIGAAFGQTAVGFLVNNYGITISLLIITTIGFFISYFIYNEISRAQEKFKVETETVKPKTVSMRMWYKRLLIVFRKRYIWAGGIIAALLFTPTTVFAELWGVTYMSKVYSYSPVQSSFISSMIFIGWAIGAALSGALTVFTKDKIKLIRYGAFGAFIVSFFILYMRLPFNVLCYLCLLFGILSSVQVLAFVMGRDVVPAKIAGIAGSAINLVCMGVGVGFQTLAGGLLDMFWAGVQTKDGVKIYPIFAYKMAVFVIPVVLLLCFFFTFLIDSENKRFYPLSSLKSKFKFKKFNLKAI